MKKAVIAWGRMNPVTSGHEKLVDKVKAVARREGGEPRIYLSHTQNAKKDPLHYKDKIAMGKKAFGSLVKTSTSRTLIQLMQELQKAGFTEIVMVAGSDRMAEYKTLLNKYNGKDYSFDKIKIVSAGQRDPDAEGAAGMSATKLRKAAADGKFDDYVDDSGKKQLGFKSGLPKNLQGPNAKKLYKLVRKGLLVENIILIDEEELENFTEEELQSFVNEVEDWEKLDEEYIEERAPLTLQQRIKKARIMKRLAPKLKRQREIRKFRMAPTERLVQRARKLARNLLRKKMAGKRGEQYNKLSASQKIQVDTLIQKKASSVERIAKRMLPMVRKKEIERIRSARSGTREAIERFENSFLLSEKTSTAQDSDIADRKGTQPKKYHAGLSKSTKTARDAHFKKGAKMDDNNPAAYKPAPGDAKAKTKPSIYTKRYKDMFGEKEAVSKARERIKREKEADKEKHDRMLDLARTQDTRSKNAQNEALELTEKSMEALKKKASKSGISYGTLKKVYNRGVAAWRTGHRPGTTPQQWGYARVNAFITKKKAGNLNHDKDLANEYIPESYNNWTNQEPVEYAKHLSKTFGAPDEMTDSQLCWFAKDGFKRIVIKDEHILHGSPAPHYDFIYCYVDIAVPEKFARALAESSGSIMIDYLKGEVGARCGSLTANACTLNYVLDVVAERVAPSKAEYEKRILEMRRMFDSGREWSVDWWPDESGDADPKNQYYAEGHSRVCGCNIQEGDGLWHNIHKKRREGRKPRKAFSKGAPTKQDFKNASENFQDGKNPQDKGDASRHGLKGKTKAQLKKIRSSSTASKRKKQLAHWMINMHHNEEHGAGEEGTDKLVKKYKKDTPQ